MDIHRYNKRTGYIDKTSNVCADNAYDVFYKLEADIAVDPFCTYSRVIILNSTGNVLDSDRTLGIEKAAMERLYS